MAARYPAIVPVQLLYRELIGGSHNRCVALCIEQDGLLKPGLISGSGDFPLEVSQNITPGGIGG